MPAKISLATGCVPFLLLPLWVACSGTTPVDDGAGGQGATGGAGAGDSNGGAAAAGGSGGGDGVGGDASGSGGEGGAPPPPTPPRVLVIASDAAGAASDLTTKLLQTGSFEVVDTFDLGGDLCPEQVATPSLTELQQYDVALVYLESFPQPRFALGDVLADYFETGGRVVTGMIPPGGRFAGLNCFIAGQCSVGCNAGAKQYGLIPLSSPIGSSAVPDSLGEVLEPDSPLLAGVSALEVQTPLRFGSANLADTSSVVAAWASGAPLVVRGEVDGRSRVDLNLLPFSEDTDAAHGWHGDGIALLQNALLYGE